MKKWKKADLSERAFCEKEAVWFMRRKAKSAFKNTHNHCEILESNFKRYIELNNYEDEESIKILFYWIKEIINEINLQSFGRKMNKKTNDKVNQILKKILEKN